MDKVNYYRQIIQKFIKVFAADDLEVRLILDSKCDRFFR